MQSLKSSYYNLCVQAVERCRYVEIALTGSCNDKVIRIFNELLERNYIENRKLNKIINVNNKYREALLDYFGLVKKPTNVWVTDKNVFGLLFS